MSEVMHKIGSGDTPTSNVTLGSECLDRTLTPRDRGLLIFMSGSHAGRIHRLTDHEVHLGRSRRCSLFFDDSTLSRHHATITRIGGDWVLEDAGSLNGCFVNQVRCTRSLLRHGDRIRLGSGVRLQFQLASPEEEQVLVHLYEAAVRDGLTGLANRRSLDERLASEFAHAVRHGRELCVLLADVDRFKVVNDSHGHLAGDEVLRVMAQVMAAAVRCEDVIARYGGEEFVVVARETPMAGALILAERLRRLVADQNVIFEGVRLQVTASFGVASLSSLPGRPTVPDLLAAADEALYRAKEGGRNRVSTYEPVE